MQTYKIKTKGKEIILKSDQNMQELKTSPALFFVTDGDFQVKECGRLKSIKKLTHHMTSLFKTVRINNG